MDALATLMGRLPDGVVSTHPGELASRSRDQWALALLREARGERLPRPMAVVFPGTTEDVSTTLAWAVETGTSVVPRGGGSGVTGGAQASWRSVVLDLSRMNRILSVDEESLAVEVEAGVRGDRLDAHLSGMGLTLGHYPQSLAISTVGGWLASASAGQASAGYGTIEDLVLGLTAVLPGGEVMRLRPAPRSAAGPDLRRLLVGSEGTLAVITEAVLSASRAPGSIRWAAYGPNDFSKGVALSRALIQDGIRPLVLRLYDEADARLAMSAAGHDGGPLLLLGFRDDDAAGFEEARERARSARVKKLSESLGEHWWEHRNDAVTIYRRVMGEERMMGPGVVVDTMEVAGLWKGLDGLYQGVREALREHASQPVGCHLSHPYRSGASLYFTFLIHAEDDEQAERRYVACWSNAARACHEAGGTISHHHGIGLLKAPFLKEELGDAGLEVLRSVKRALDPGGVLNPGKLLP